MNADDRAVVEEIKRTVKAIAIAVDRGEKIQRGLSSTLIGKINGQTIDDGGGRIGRLEKLVTWAIGGVVGILVWLVAQLITKIIK